jgi:gas vesicle protein
MHDGYYRRGGSVLGAFLLGGLVGAVLGLLFAPRSGKETREMIAERAEDYWGEAGEMYATGKDKVVEVYGTGVDKVTEMASTTKDAAAEKGEELRAKIDEARERLQEQVAKSAEGAKTKIDEVAPAAKDAVDRAAAGTKNGIDTAAAKTSSGLDTVAKRAKTSKNGEEVDADIQAALDDAVSATAEQGMDNPLPPV